MSPDWFTRGHRPVYPVSLTGEENRLDVTDLGSDREAGDPADPGGGFISGDVAMACGRLSLQPALDLRDPPVEIVDELNARPDETKPRLREVQAGE